MTPIATMPGSRKQEAVTAIANGSSTIRTALAGHPTIGALKIALAAAGKVRTNARDLEAELRREIASMEAAERQWEREAARAERRNQAILRERGLPTGSGDLSIPAMA